jgi:hypothetical protein
METERVRIYKAIVRAEIQFQSFKEIEANKAGPLYYQREIRRVIRLANVKTVYVALERGGKSVTVKTDAERLGLNDSISEWNVVSPDRAAYKEIFGYGQGGDAGMNEITAITHGRKELYNKAAFEKTLQQ